MGDVREPAEPEPPVIVKLTGFGGIIGESGLRCGGAATREGDGGRLLRTFTVGETGVLAGRGPGSRLRGGEGKRCMTDGDAGGMFTVAVTPGLLVGTDGNEGSIALIPSSSSSMEGKAWLNSDSV